MCVCAVMIAVSNNLIETHSGLSRGLSKEASCDSESDSEHLPRPWKDDEVCNRISNSERFCKG